MKILVTGGCGFLGHHFVEHIVKSTNWDIVILDKLSYASYGLDRLRDIKVWPECMERVQILTADLTQPLPQGVMMEIGEVDYIFHFAAETHVDDSIEHPVPFVMNNVASTLTMLEFARTLKHLKMFINFSTDEVYGPAPEDYAFKEFEYHYPSNPYSASKSAQEALGIAYSNTYKVPVINTHTMNLFGERQHPQKYIPLVIRKVLEGDILYIHANKAKTKAGSRFYIHCRNLSDALLHIVNLGYNGYNEWNIAGLEEVDNLKLAQFIAGIIGKPLRYELVDFHGSRPGHDLRYALDCSKLLASGYQYPKTLWESLEQTIKWTSDNRGKWLYRR